jgi:hypothetical protein
MEIVSAQDSRRVVPDISTITTTPASDNVSSPRASPRRGKTTQRNYFAGGHFATIEIAIRNESVPRRPAGRKKTAYFPGTFRLPRAS